MLISYSHEKKASFRTVYGDLSDYLIKSLTKHFFSDGADAFSFGLSVFKRFI